jgi:hypothetical protein
MKTMLVFAFATAMLLISLSLMAADPDPAGNAAAAARPTTRPVDPEVSADAVIRQLMTSRAKRAVLPKPTTAPTSQPATVAPAEIVRPLPMPPGAMIVDRVGRVIKDENSQWWQFHFSSERSVLYEAPMRVLPNRLLEAMETIMEKSNKTRVRFRVTGEITTYRGKRYLLIRRMLVKRELGAM